jgi:hypothetical protein
VELVAVEAIMALEAEAAGPVMSVAMLSVAALEVTVLMGSSSLSRISRKNL